MTASSAGSRNTRGLAFPDCGFGTTPPSSTKPKPSAMSASGTSHCLSKPAASPTGFGKRRPNAATSRRGSSAGAAPCGASASALMVS